MKGEKRDPLTLITSTRIHSHPLAQQPTLIIRCYGWALSGADAVAGTPAVVVGACHRGFEAKSMKSSYYAQTVSASIIV